MYEDKFSLTARAFGAMPDADMFVRTTPHENALGYLEFGLRLGEGCIVLSGAPGTGKTILLSQIARALHEASAPVFHLDVAWCGDGEIFAALGYSICGPDVAATGKYESLRLIRSHLKTYVDKGITPVLLLDNCEHLCPEDYDSICTLLTQETTGKPLSQIVFSGNIPAAQLRKHVKQLVCHAHIAPLAPGHLRKYIDGRLEKVSKNTPLRFDDSAIEALMAITGGVPATINLVADRVLFDGFLEDRPLLSGNHIISVSKELQAEGVLASAQEASPDTLSKEGLSDSEPEMTIPEIERRTSAVLQIGRANIREKGGTNPLQQPRS